MKYKIIIISSGQPALNPRLVKEADTLVASGYDVKVIYQYWNAWGTIQDERLLKNKKWDYVRVGGAPNEQELTYWYSRFRSRFFNVLYKHFPNNKFFAEKALGRCVSHLIKEALKHKADLYIAHNPAALPAASKAARKFDAKYGFDAEDFHRNELKDDIHHLDYQKKKIVEDLYLPSSSYLTTSSPAIEQLYKNLYSELNGACILNVFPIQNFIRKRVDDGNLHLVWFSQTIGRYRGIESIIAALNVSDKIRLHLLGDLSHNMQSYFERLCIELKVPLTKIMFYPPIPSSEIIPFCSQFDIGIASEPGFSINNDAALSNKLFTYLQAGLAIVTSDTSSQQTFMAKHKDIGSIYSNNHPEQLRVILKDYLTNPSLLQLHQAQALKLSTDKYNWEIEEKKFLTLIKEVFKN